VPEGTKDVPGDMPGTARRTAVQRRPTIYDQPTGNVCLELRATCPGGLKLYKMFGIVQIRPDYLAGPSRPAPPEPFNPGGEGFQFIPDELPGHFISKIEAGVKPGVRPTNEDFRPVERQHVEEDWRVVDTPCVEAGVPVGRVLVTREMLAGMLELINRLRLAPG
jgi:hypothetical protein